MYKVEHKTRAFHLRLRQENYMNKIGGRKRHQNGDANVCRGRGEKYTVSAL